MKNDYTYTKIHILLVNRKFTSLRTIWISWRGNWSQALIILAFKVTSSSSLVNTVFKKSMNISQTTQRLMGSEKKKKIMQKYRFLKENSEWLGAGLWKQQRFESQCRVCKLAGRLTSTHEVWKKTGVTKNNSIGPKLRTVTQNKQTQTNAGLVKVLVNIAIINWLIDWWDGYSLILMEPRSQKWS